MTHPDHRHIPIPLDAITGITSAMGASLSRPSPLPSSELLVQRHSRAAPWATQRQAKRGTPVPCRPNEGGEAEHIRRRKGAEVRLVESALRTHALHQTVPVVPLDCAGKC
jgi:hypothetical protein